MVFEHRREPLASRSVFVGRMIASLAVSLLVVILSLALGMWGYHSFENMTWIDAFANASMILSGMGPLQPLETDAGKIFAGVYALYSGLAIITITGITLAPVVHRFLHRLHADEEDLREIEKEQGS